MKNLIQAIESNRRRQAKCDKAERTLRAVRLKAFDHQDDGREAKARRIIARCKAILAPRWRARQRALDASKRLNPSGEPGV
jgi:hypothetical protein